MKKLLLTGLSLAVVCVLFFSWFPCLSFAGPSEQIRLNLAFPGTPRSFSARAHAWWAEEVERRTGGRLKITPHWGGSLARHNEMVKLVGSGAIDMGESSWAPYNPRVFPLHTITDGPVIWRKQPLALIYAGMQLEKEVPEVAAENTRANLKRLTWLGAGVSGVMMKKTPVQHVHDLKGRQIRTVGRYLQPPLLKAAGAVPVSIPFPEVYDAMQKGMIDGAAGTLGLFAAIKFHEICDYYIELGMGGDPGHGIMMNLDTYNSLPEDIKKELMQLYEKDFPKIFVERFAVPEYVKSREIFEKAGVKSSTLPEEEMARWKKLQPTEKHAAPWVKVTAKASGLPESRVREILKKYIQLVDHFETIYSEKW